MKTFILTCALWGATLLPRVDCQVGTTVGCLESLQEEDQKKFEACMGICQGPGFTEVEKPLPGYVCIAKSSGSSFVPGYEQFLLTPDATATTTATNGAATSSKSDSNGGNSLKDDSDDGGQGASDDGQVSDGSSDTTMGDSQISSEELQARKSGKKGTPVGAIAGGVVGGVVFLAIVGFLAFFLARRRKKNAAVHHEAVAVLDKSRASSPTSHASPIYGGAAPSSAAPTRQTTYEDSLSQAPSQPQFAPSPAPAPAPAPPPPVIEPQELHSREVDEDGVSVSSFDIQRTEERSVPRLPVYHRDTPPGGSSAAL